MLASGRPRFGGRKLRIKKNILEEALTIHPASNADSKETQTEENEADFLKDLLGFKDLETPSSAVVTTETPTALPSLPGNDPVQSDASHKAKKRVRRRCPSGWWGCPLPTSSSLAVG